MPFAQVFKEKHFIIDGLLVGRIAFFLLQLI
jgi:hypothetical protein